MTNKLIEKAFASAPTPYPPFSDGLAMVISGRLMVKNVESKTKSRYLAVSIKDANNTSYSVCIFKNGTANLFEFLSQYVGKGTVPCIAELSFKEKESYKNIEISNIEITADDESAKIVTDYSPQLRNAINSIKDPFLHAVVKRVFSQKDFAASFMICPATECSAYNVRGGLLHLVVDTANMANTVAMALNNNYSGEKAIVNRDLLMAGTLLCNIGRVYAFYMDEFGNILKTESGVMNGDSLISRDLVRDVISVISKENKASETPFEILEDVVSDLLHMIAACRGRLDYGSIAVPRTKHAMILSNVCDLVFTKALFETLEDGNGETRVVKAYDSGRSYLQLN